MLLDVREPWEFQTARIENSINVPMSVLVARVDEVRELAGDDKPLVVICHHGGRSMQVAMFLERKGFGSVHNLMGGLEAWAGEVDPNMRRY